MKLKSISKNNKYIQRLEHLVASGMNIEEAAAVLKKKMCEAQVYQNDTSALSEMHYQDFYGAGFEEFRKKYLRVKKDPSLYVNFNDHYSDPLMRGVSPKTDHEDPSGTYAYPLAYVVDHPMDVRYGKTAKYLRVIKKKSGDVLYIQFVDEGMASKLLYKTKGYLYFRDKLSIFKKHFDSKHIPRIFYGLMRISKEGIEKMVEHYSNKSTKNTSFNAQPYFISSQQMTEQFKSLGYTVIEDHAKNSSKAAINKWEPEQIIFLDRTAFEVVEVFNISGKTGDGFLVNTSSEYQQILYRKLAARICDGIGDKLMSSKAATSNRGGFFVFYTNAGRQIGIMQENTTFDPDKKFGDKKHKEHKLVDGEAYRVFIRSEKPLYKHEAKSTDRMIDTANTIVSEWTSLKGTDPDFSATRDEQSDNQRITNLRNREIHAKYVDRVSKAKVKPYIISFVKENFGIDLENYEGSLRGAYADVISKALSRLIRFDKNPGLAKIHETEGMADNAFKVAVNSPTFEMYNSIQGFSVEEAVKLAKIVVSKVLESPEKFDGKLRGLKLSIMQQYPFEALDDLAYVPEE